ncbi:MAG: TraR/DksA C4-type zinc finger protein [Rhodospirillaceae bacterium]|nr:TraR/DksA C4-type zinc finger protein [Rhodospirillaceae bacterium]
MDTIDAAQAREQDRRDAALHRFRDARAAAQHDAANGICADCGAPIAPARLAAHPRAARCLNCQAALERRAGR